MIMIYKHKSQPNTINKQVIQSFSGEALSHASSSLDGLYIANAKLPRPPRFLSIT